MVRHVARRLALSIAVLLGASVIVFLLTFLSGDPVLLMLPSDATPNEVETMRRSYGFDRPLWEQYARFLARAIQGDFGMSLRHRLPAMRLVLERLPATFVLTVAGLGLAVAIGVPLGIIAATKRNSVVDLAATFVGFFGQSIANFWLAIMLIYIFAVRLPWFPTFGTGTPAHLVLPTVAVASRLMALLTRLTRSTMLEVLDEDYVRTARSKGLAQSSVVGKHALRNTLLPLVTVIGLQFGTLMGGTVIIETIFAWPGVGFMAVQAITNRDFPVVQAAVFVLAVGFVAINLIVDLLYSWLDPRIRLVGVG